MGEVGEVLLAALAAVSFVLSAWVRARWKGVDGVLKEVIREAQNAKELGDRVEEILAIVKDGPTESQILGIADRIGVRDGPPGDIEKLYKMAAAVRTLRSVAQCIDEKKTEGE